MRVRGADEVDVAHPVPLHVVEEDALPLDEPPVLLPRHALPDPAGLRLGRLDDQGFSRYGGLAHVLPSFRAEPP